MKARCAAATLSDGTVPPDADAALVLRHAHREDIPPDSFGANVRLTEWGAASAERLGETLSARRPGVLASSPIPRCVETAHAISRGAGWRPEVITDQRLGDPGAFVTQSDLAGQTFSELDVVDIVRRQLIDAEPPPGMRSAAEGASILLDLVTNELADSGCLNIYVTHDAILAPLIGWVFHLPVYEEGWPDFLDGVLLWRSAGRLYSLHPDGKAPVIIPSASGFAPTPQSTRWPHGARRAERSRAHGALARY